jgi:hypothetical protein
MLRMLSQSTEYREGTGSDEEFPERASGMIGDNFRPIFPEKSSEHLDERRPGAYPDILI